MRLPIPVNIITGALGVGKTSTISRLIEAKLLSPSHKAEKWAILVNEFGALGIDGALLAAAATGGALGILVVHGMQSSSLTWYLIY